MSDCCGNNQQKQTSDSSCCGGEDGKTVLIYACSGGANVGEIADKAARELMFAGEGTMFCLAGLGGDIQGMVQTARDADLNLVIDGCPMDCAKKIFENCGLSNYVQFRVTELDIEKTKGVRGTAEQVDKVIAKARRMLAE